MTLLACNLVATLHLGKVILYWAQAEMQCGEGRRPVNDCSSTDFPSSKGPTLAPRLVRNITNYSSITSCSSQDFSALSSSINALPKGPHLNGRKWRPLQISNTRSGHASNSLWETAFRRHVSGPLLRSRYILATNCLHSASQAIHGSSCAWHELFSCVCMEYHAPQRRHCMRIMLPVLFACAACSLQRCSMAGTCSTTLVSPEALP